MTDDEPRTDGSGTDTRVDAADPRVDDADPRTDGGTDPTDDADARTDGSGPGIVPPDDETPTWRDRKERSQGLARLTYEYFERARWEDQRLREQSSYVERDVLAFPTWPHETIRNLSIASFFVGMIIFLSATMPPHIGEPANPGQTPHIILPDWYLYWSFGLLKLGPLNPALEIITDASGRPQKLMADRTYGVLANIVVVSAIAVVPFLNKGSARRPVEQPFWAAVGVGGVVFALTIAVYSAKNLVPMEPHLLFDVTFLLPVVSATVAYAVLKTMREGYMYDLNRRYYRLRPPR